MKRPCLYRIIFFALASFVVQTAAADETLPEGGGIFPLVPVLDTAISGEVRWLPDWTVDMPPDAFSPSGRRRAVTVRYPGGELRLSFLRDGRLNEFPCQINGALYQAAAAWDKTGRLASVKTAFTLTAAPAADSGTAAASGGTTANGGTATAANGGIADENAAETLSIEALAYDENGYPTTLRLANGEAYFFVSIDTRGSEIIETWFEFTGASAADAAEAPAEKPDGGTVAGDTGEETAYTVAVFCHKIDVQTGRTYQILSLYPAEAPVETRSFDSFGNITRLSSRLGEFTALYNNRGLRYWGNFEIQRDETGLPVRLSQTGGGETDELRYEYRFDTHGNWTERRELRMKRTGGVLVPESGPAVSRIIDYF